MKRILTILFLLISTTSFAQMGIVNYDTIQSKAVQADSALWIKYLENGSTDTILTHINGKVAYILPGQILLIQLDSTNFRVTESQISDLQNYQLDSDTIIWDATKTDVQDIEDSLAYYMLTESFTDSIPTIKLTRFDSTGFRVTIPQVVDLQDLLSQLNNMINEGFTNAHEGDPLFQDWNRTDGINIFSKQIIDFESTFKPYALLEDITGGIRDADFTSLSINGTDLAIILNDTANVVRSEIPLLLTELDSSNFRITEEQISNLQHFTNSDETDQVYAADSTQIKQDIAALQAVTDVIEIFTANSGQTNFTLTNSPTQEYTVSQNGVVLPPSAYTINTNTLALTVGVWENDRIQITYKYQQ